MRAVVPRQLPGAAPGRRGGRDVQRLQARADRRRQDRLRVRRAGHRGPRRRPSCGRPATDAHPSDHFPVTARIRSALARRAREPLARRHGARVQPPCSEGGIFPANASVIHSGPISHVCRCTPCAPPACARAAAALADPGFRRCRRPDRPDPGPGQGRARTSRIELIADRAVPGPGMRLALKFDLDPGVAHLLAEPRGLAAGRRR
ncbi:MAG: hypothetical protein M0C28_23315 [Candidatus Moduliflexus flocculans]|nr:hypothetical protein [Candidatus Moduliflexus flocculans]